MIFGVGTDIIEVDRIQAADARFGARFAERILGPREMERYKSRRERSEERGIRYLATRFAAKEAVSKALGLGMRQPMSWRAVEIVNDPSGRPVAFISSPELRHFAERRRLRVHVSVSDEKSVAMAYAVAEAEEGAWR
ncbi:MAG: holo-ACP synthase [Burkholderiaceae bacterium]|jgi:holo-[acyl-carrier protein] synthase|nr:holo-ACP synthase [Burkholderiaceae bacterium]